VKIWIDRECCFGHGRCYETAPDLFEDDEDGRGVVKGDGSISPATIDMARLAVRQCPEHAVKLTD